MRTKLTSAFVTKVVATPGADRSIFWDEALPCFGLVVTARGHKSFVVQYRADGISRRMAFKEGLSLDQAKKKLSVMLPKAGIRSRPAGGMRRRQKIPFKTWQRNISNEREQSYARNPNARRHSNA
jgi:hypothetical protein